jgi:tripartite-type tricarboxylate transporter receptor subunit TctC
MTRVRRQFLTIAGVGLGAAVLPSVAWPQPYPTHTVRVIVPYPAGGTTDVIARGVTHWLASVWNQPIVIENKAGANTRIGTEFVAKASPDGYTLLVTAEATFVINPHLYPKLSYQLTDFAPVSGLGISTQMLVAHPSAPAQNLADLIIVAKSKPNELTYGTFGVGSSSHLNMEKFQIASGVKLNPIHRQSLRQNISCLTVSLGSRWTWPLPLPSHRTRAVV